MAPQVPRLRPRLRQASIGDDCEAGTQSATVDDPSRLGALFRSPTANLVRCELLRVDAPQKTCQVFCGALNNVITSLTNTSRTSIISEIKSLLVYDIIGNYSSLLLHDEQSSVGILPLLVIFDTTGLAMNGSLSPAQVALHSDTTTSSLVTPQAGASNLEQTFLDTRPLVATHCAGTGLERGIRRCGCRLAGPRAGPNLGSLVGPERGPDRSMYFRRYLPLQCAFNSLLNIYKFTRSEI